MNNPYTGKITHAGTQVVKPSGGDETRKGKTTVKTGDDLRKK